MEVPQPHAIRERVAVRDGWTDFEDAEPLQERPVGDCAAAARLVLLEEGLFAVTVSELAAPGGSANGLPMLLVAAPPSAIYDRPDILAAWDEHGGWIGPAGGTVVVRSPPGGGQVLITLYDSPARPSTLDIHQLEMRRIDRDAIRPTIERRSSPAVIEEPELLHPLMPQADRIEDDLPIGNSEPALPQGSADAASNANEAQGPELEEDLSEALDDPSKVPIRVLLHIEDQGDRVCGGGTWGGMIGQQLRVEGVSIRPSGPLSGESIRYMAFGPGGRETRWVNGGQLCGARGRGVPLTGFAVQLVGDEAAPYSVIYQGAFFLSGVTPPCADGTPCLPLYPDDHLEAVNVQIVRRDSG